MPAVFGTHTNLIVSFINGLILFLFCVVFYGVYYYNKLVVVNGWCLHRMSNYNAAKTGELKMSGSFKVHVVMQPKTLQNVTNRIIVLIMWVFEVWQYVVPYTLAC